jgi:hypothetical protein
MSDTNKLIIVVLVAVVVLFVLGISVGAGGGIKTITVDGIKNTLIGLFPTPALPLDEISASPSSCLNRDQRRIVVPSVGGCLFTIAPSDATVRALKLQIAPGVSVNITTVSEPAEDKEMTIDVDLPSHGSNQTTFTFYQSEVPKTMTISQCSNAGGCVLNILE